MRDKTQHFILNKESDFMRGYGAVYRDGVAYVEEYFLSKLYDAGKKGMRWYRLDSQLKIPANSRVTITFYVTDEETVECDGKLYEIRKVLNERISLQEKKKIISTLERKTVKLQQDVLLAELQGRFLFFLVENLTGREQMPGIMRMKLYFQPNMWIQDLPEVFRQENNGFLERYLAIFQNIYEEMEEEIRGSSDQYSVHAQSYEFLLWLSSWYCMTQPQLWTKEQLQYLLKNSYRIYKRLGTREIMEEICGLYLGEQPIIVEYHEAEKLNLGKDNWSVNPYVFTIIIKNRHLSNMEFDHFVKIVDSCRPVHMEANIIFLDHHEKDEDGITLS